MSVHNLHYEQPTTGDVYIGRSSIPGGSFFGNPFVIGRDGDRETVITLLIHDEDGHAITFTVIEDTTRPGHVALVGPSGIAIGLTERTYQQLLDQERRTQDERF